MTEASSGYRTSHSSATSLVGPHFSPSVVASSEPRNAKILPPTLATTSPSHGSSCHAPGLARQYASISALVMAPPRTGRTSGAPRSLSSRPSTRQSRPGGAFQRLGRKGQDGLGPFLIYR